VLHTWGQNLLHHPHLHCVVPAGGLSADGAAWVPGREDYYLPVKVLSRVFRGKFLAFLKQAIGRGQLAYHGSLAPLADPDEIERLLDRTVRTHWVVYAKRPFGGPEQVLKYLARYTHRVAISNRRLLRLEGGQVTFSWKDYAHGSQPSTMTLAAVEFIRRFLLHVLPSSFVKIRYYGFMANRCRRENLARCRQLLGHDPAATLQDQPEQIVLTAEVTDETPRVRCPVCRKGTMRIIRRLDRQQGLLRTSLARSPPAIPPPDTS
jgi:hypothetical protein